MKKNSIFSRLMTENGIACVVVGFPATPIVSARVRFCLSGTNRFLISLNRPVLIVSDLLMIFYVEKTFYEYELDDSDNYGCLTSII